MIKDFIFEDFTLILSRNCNLNCNYCPLNHFEANMSKDVINVFFEEIFWFKDYKINITLFWWEPLINKDWIFYILEILKKNHQLIKKNKLHIRIKLITNWTLISDTFIEIFKQFNLFEQVDFLIDISIDWNKNTQLKQRNLKLKNLDYFDNFIFNIKKLLKNKIKIELFMVIDFFNVEVGKDLLFLINEFKVPVFLMPVDLTYDYITSNKNIKKDIKIFMKKLQFITNIVEKHNLKNIVANYRPRTKRNLKIPPIWPCFDYNWDCYFTRDFLFQMDKDFEFKPIWNISELDFWNTVSIFEANFSQIQNYSLKTYYGKSYVINKKIWDYFTDLIFWNN